MSAISLWSTANAGAKSAGRASVFADVRPTYLVIGALAWGAFAFRLFATLTL